jgi:broad specificity phosphatase PhoE
MLNSGGVLSVYFIRHGQAGSRQDYDHLSDVGREQAARLGTWLARRELRFSQAWSGRLSRQRETAERVRAAYHDTSTGAAFPEIIPHPCWDEFDLDGVYRAIAPQLARDDPEFSRQYEELQLQAREAASRVHRAWSPCDTTVVRAWIDSRYACEGESFAAFSSRVRSARDMLQDTGSPQNIAVFTSATPAAIWTALALDLDGRKVMQLAGVTYNTSLTLLRVDQERVRLFQFNTVPHLDTQDLLTHR